MSSVSNELGQSPAVGEALIGAARKGCQKSLGEISARYRRYLLHVANDSLNPALRAKVAPSDLVQEAMLAAHQSFSTFAGSTEAELLAWLRHIVYFRALQAARRYFGTASRDARREICLDESRSTPKEQISDRAITPCTGLVAKEQTSCLEEALAELEENPRRVIEMRSARLSFAQIGEVLGCSAEAARKRWARAIAQLRLPLSKHE